MELAKTAAEGARWGRGMESGGHLGVGKWEANMTWKRTWGPAAQQRRAGQAEERVVGKTTPLLLLSPICKRQCCLRKGFLQMIYGLRHMETAK